MGIGGTGLSADIGTVPSDLEVIYQGGQFFLDRMKVLTDAKTNADASLAALNLGKDIVSAQVNANAALANANKAQAAAAQTLVDAQKQAAEIIDNAKAKAQATDIVNVALANAAKTKADSDAAEKKSDDYITRRNAKAEAALKDAQDQLAAINLQLIATKKAEQDFLAAKADQETATKAANDAQKIYQQKLAQIKSVIG